LRASWAAKFTATVVLPTPPFPLVTTIFLAICTYTPRLIFAVTYGIEHHTTGAHTDFVGFMKILSTFAKSKYSILYFGIFRKRANAKGSLLPRFSSLLP
jgi:hypothetical protein